MECHVNGARPFKLHSAAEGNALLGVCRYVKVAGLQYIFPSVLVVHVFDFGGFSEGADLVF